VTAVENDNTFIVFNCGRHERIGIRHRASQTLFLSGLIDPIYCSDPHYGKLHTALFLAIFEDLYERDRLTNSISAKTESRKRAADSLENELPSSKRAQPDPPAVLEPEDNQVVS